MKIPKACAYIHTLFKGRSLQKCSDSRGMITVLAECFMTCKQWHKKRTTDALLSVLENETFKLHYTSINPETMKLLQKENTRKKMFVTLFQVKGL